MTIVYDTSRKRVALPRELARGGEGVIYVVQGRQDRLAKIYAGTPPTGAKLAWMKDHPPADPTAAIGHVSIAWPRELLFNARGVCVGFQMPRIRDAVPLFDVFNPRRRARILPDFNGRYLHRTARNLASAIGALHARDYVVGDLNESNVLVTPTALVTLIDTDSFQVREQRGGRAKVYPCPVGKPEYTPPELQGQSFQQVVRLPEHDRFALGVLIFQLLMEGNHPFRARWLGLGDPPSLEAKIQQGAFPHQKPPPKSFAPPARTPALDTLQPGLAYLIQRCFVDGHRNPKQRPSPAEWIQALTEAERALTQCRNGHYFSSHLRSCPRCGLGHQGKRVALPPAKSAVPKRPATQPSKPAAPRPRPRPATAMPAIHSPFPTPWQWPAFGRTWLALLVVVLVLWGSWQAIANDAPDASSFAVPTVSAHGQGVNEVAASDWAGAYLRLDGEAYGRPWAVIYGAQSDYPSAWFTVTLDQVAPGEATLSLTGLDDEWETKTLIAIEVNGEQIYSGRSPFENASGPNHGGANSWQDVTFPIREGLLRVGDNTIVVRNLEPAANFSAPPFILLSDAVLTSGRITTVEP